MGNRQNLVGENRQIQIGVDKDGDPNGESDFEGRFGGL